MAKQKAEPKVTINFRATPKMVEAVEKKIETINCKKTTYKPLDRTSVITALLDKWLKDETNI